MGLKGRHITLALVLEELKNRHANHVRAVEAAVGACAWLGCWGPQEWKRTGMFPQRPQRAFTPETRGGSRVENRCGRLHGYLKAVKPEWPAVGREEGAPGQDQEMGCQGQQRGLMPEAEAIPSSGGR